MHTFVILNIQGLKTSHLKSPMMQYFDLSVIVIILSRKFYFGPGFQQNWLDLYLFVHHSFNIGFRAYYNFPHKDTLSRVGSLLLTAEHRTPFLILE